jgi:hypothetical protein
MDDLENRTSMIDMVEREQESVRNGQRDLFVSKRRLPRSIRDDYELFFSIIRKHL